MWSHCSNYWSFSFTPPSGIIMHTRFPAWSYIPYTYMLLPGILQSLAALLCSSILSQPLTQCCLFFSPLSVVLLCVQCRPFAPHLRWGRSCIEGPGSCLRWGGTGEGGGVRHRATLLVPRKEERCDSLWICLKTLSPVNSQQSRRRFLR